MEHRNEYASPRDMLDDAMLQRILADMAEETCNARSNRSGGCGGSQRQSDKSGDNDADNRSGRSCGCSGTDRSQRKSDKSGDIGADNRSGRSCGCGVSDRSQRQSDRSGCSGADSHPGRTCGCGRAQSNSFQQRQSTETGSGWPAPQDHGCCMSGPSVPALQSFPLAMVFSPNQDWEGILDAEEALSKGTLFSGLIFPWYPSRCRDGQDCGCGRG